MKLPLYQVDAFTNKIFSGNPACVVPLKEWLPDEILLKLLKKTPLLKLLILLKMVPSTIYDGSLRKLKWTCVDTLPLPRHIL